MGKKDKTDNLEPKKLALLRIWQILKAYSDYEHPLKQEEIADYLERDYRMTPNIILIGAREC